MLSAGWSARCPRAFLGVESSHVAAFAQDRGLGILAAGNLLAFMGDALEQLRREPERETTISLAVAMRAGKAVPGVHQQIGPLGQQRRPVLVAYHEAAG